jgi:hypothetical protein
MSQTKQLFESIINVFYGLNKKYINDEALYDDYHNILSQTIDDLMKLKFKKDYPMCLFENYLSGSNKYSLHQMLIEENMEYSALDPILNNLCDCFAPTLPNFGEKNYCEERKVKKILFAKSIFEIYFIEDIVKHNQGNIFLWHSGMNIVYNLKKDFINSYSLVEISHVCIEVNSYDLYNCLKNRMHEVRLRTISEIKCSELD